MGNRNSKDNQASAVNRDDIVDSLTVLTGLSIGDVKSQINDGNFAELAVQALIEFKLKYYKYYLGGEEIVEELNTVSILESALDTVELELHNATEPSKREILKREAEDLKASILREKDDQD